MPMKRSRYSKGAYGSKYKRRRPWSAGTVRYKRTGTRYRGKKKYARAISKLLSEPKTRFTVVRFVDALGFPNFYHNTLYECVLHDAGNTSTNVPTCMAVNAVNTGFRTGHEIYSTGFRVRGTFSVPYDRRNAIMKLWLVEYNSAQGNPTTKTEFFNTGQSGNIMLDTIDPERFPGVKLLRKIRLQARDIIDASGVNATVYYDIWIPWRRTCKYRDVTAVAPNVIGGKERLSLILGVYDTPSTPTTSIVVDNHEQNVTFYYRDP